MKSESFKKPALIGAAGALGVTFATGLFLYFDTADIPKATPQESDWRSQLTERSAPSAQADPISEETSPKTPPRVAEAGPREDRTDDITNELLPIGERRRQAFLLAEEDEQAAMEALRKLMEEEGSSATQAALAEALGASDNPEVKALIDQLASGEDEMVARGAIRGIASRGSAEDADTLSGLLHNVRLPDSVRTEAALGLGDMGTPEALNHLMRASYTAVDFDDFEPVFQSVLAGLGMQDFENTADYFARLLEHPEIDHNTRVTALDALADAEGDASSLLLEYTRHEDPEVREAAAWSLALREDVQKVAAQLTEQLASESDPEVRSRLYHAVDASGAEVESLWNQVIREKDQSAFLAGAGMLAREVSSPESTLASRFDRDAVPPLKTIALESPDFGTQLKAINTLGRANSPQAQAALKEIYASNSDPRIQRAVEVARMR